MVDLKTQTPCHGLLPIQSGPFSLDEESPGQTTLISPFAGQEMAVSAALKASCGVPFPAPGRVSESKDSRIIWFGQDAALLCGAECPDLTGLAAVCDQSDAWAVVRLSGLSVESVLARLSPVDLRPAVFKVGSTLRTLLGHMNASITRIDDQSLQVMVFRSMAVTLAEEMQEAMEAVAARG